MRRSVPSILVLLLVAAPVLLAQRPARLSPPSNVTVAGAGTLKAAVSWSAASGATGYLVWRQAGTAAAVQLTASPITSLSYLDAVPAPGTYQYQVASVARNGSQATSGWVSFTAYTATTSGSLEPRPTGTPTLPPPGPSSLTASPATLPGQCDLRWSVVGDAQKYQIYRAGSTESERMVKEILASSQMPEAGYYFHTDAPIALKTAYQYRVFAVFGNGTLSGASPSATCTSAAVTNPSGLIVTAVLNNSYVYASARWQPVTGAIGYVVELYAATTTGSWSKLGQTSVSDPAVTVSNVPLNPTGGTAYRLCVGTTFPYNVRDMSTATCAAVPIIN